MKVCGVIKHVENAKYLSHQQDSTWKLSLLRREDKLFGYMPGD